MRNLTEKQGSEFEWIWIFIVRIVGALMFLFPLFLPLRAYLYESKENITIHSNDWLLIAIGLLLFSGGKNIGVILNNIGIGLTNLINKITK